MLHTTMATSDGLFEESPIYDVTKVFDWLCDVYILINERHML